MAFKKKQREENLLVYIIEKSINKSEPPGMHFPLGVIPRQALLN